MSAITNIEQPSKRKRALVVGLAAVVLSAGLAGAAFQTTGAWFSASKTASGNTVTAGTLALGNVGDGTSEAITAANVFPMTDGQATAATSAAVTANINVRNIGTLPMRWTVALSNYTLAPKTGTAVLDDTKVKVAYKVGTTWTVTTLKAFIATPPAAVTAATEDLAAGATKTIELRVFFDSTADDTFQGAKVGFNATVGAQQTNKV